jgi:hypothetical protein
MYRHLSVMQIRTVRILQNSRSRLRPRRLARSKGAYTSGPAMNDQIDITFESYLGHPEPQIVWTRKGVLGRPLCHLGDRIFYPVGASAVRIRFNQQDSAILITIEDPTSS